MFYVLFLRILYVYQFNDKKNSRHYIAKILLKLVQNTNQSINQSYGKSKSNMMGATIWPETAYPSWALSSSPVIFVWFVLFNL